MTAAAAIYLDYNATAPVRPAAAAAVAAALSTTGNPSSVHGFGRAARRLVEDAREAVAALVGATPGGIVFTSGGSEANALALAGWNRRRLLVSAIEHPSVAQAAAGAWAPPGMTVEAIPVDPCGAVDLDALAALLSASAEPALVALMLANNETGVIQPVAAAAALAHAHGAVLHCDAVQAVGKMPVVLDALGADSLALSGHKLGAPQGTGALVLAEGEAELRPLWAGGGQEKRRRSGTENVPGIAGLGAAAAEIGAALAGGQPPWPGWAALRDRLEQGITEMAPQAVIFGAGAPRLPNTTCVALPGMAAQTMLMRLDLAGVAVSSGSACSSGKVAPSAVLTAMGAGPLAASALRISLGWASRAADIDGFLAAFGPLAAAVRRAE